MMKLTRRSATAGLAAAALPFMSRRASSAGVYTRRGVNDPAAARDIQTLRAVWPRIVSDGSLARLTTFHREWTSAAHGGWFFLPWHRMFLLKFETLVRQVSGDAAFALPYWDLYSARALPQAFWQSPFVDGATVYRFTRSDTDFAAWRQRQQRARVGASDFYTVHGSQVRPGAIEYSYHNWLHGALGGRQGSNFAPMADVNRSPIDIAFWLHHANVDRIWDSWLAEDAERRRPGQVWAVRVGDPAPTTWSAAQLRMPRLGAAGWDLGYYSVQSVVVAGGIRADGASLGYRYGEPFSLEENPHPPPPPPPPRRPFVATGVVRGAIATPQGPIALAPAGVTSVPLKTDPETMRGLLSQAPRIGGSLANWRMTLALGGERLHESDIDISLLIDGLDGAREVTTLSTAFHGEGAHSDANHMGRGFEVALDDADAWAQRPPSGDFTLQFSRRPSPLATDQPPAINIESMAISYAIETFSGSVN